LSLASLKGYTCIYLPFNVTLISIPVVGLSGTRDMVQNICYKLFGPTTSSMAMMGKSRLSRGM